MLFVVQLVAAEANGEKVVHSSPASDMWALGVMAYEMFAGYAPCCWERESNSMTKSCHVMLVACFLSAIMHSLHADICNIDTLLLCADYFHVIWCSAAAACTAAVC